MFVPVSTGVCSSRSAVFFPTRRHAAVAGTRMLCLSYHRMTLHCLLVYGRFYSATMLYLMCRSVVTAELVSHQQDEDPARSRQGDGKVTAR